MMLGKKENHASAIRPISVPSAFSTEDAGFSIKGFESINRVKDLNTYSDLYTDERVGPALKNVLSRKAKDIKSGVCRVSLGFEKSCPVALHLAVVVRFVLKNVGKGSNVISRDLTIPLIDKWLRERKGTHRKHNAKTPAYVLLIALLEMDYMASAHRPAYTIDGTTRGTSEAVVDSLSYILSITKPGGVSEDAALFLGTLEVVRHFATSTSNGAACILEAHKDEVMLSASTTSAGTPATPCTHVVTEAYSPLLANSNIELFPAHTSQITELSQIKFEGEKATKASQHRNTDVVSIGDYRGALLRMCMPTLMECMVPGSTPQTSASQTANKHTCNTLEEDNSLVVPSRANAKAAKVAMCVCNAIADFELSKNGLFASGAQLLRTLSRWSFPSLVEYDERNTTPSDAVPVQSNFCEDIGANGSRRAHRDRLFSNVRVYCLVELGDMLCRNAARLSLIQLRELWGKLSLFVTSHVLTRMTETKIKQSFTVALATIRSQAVPLRVYESMWTYVMGCALYGPKILPALDVDVLFGEPCDLIDDGTKLSVFLITDVLPKLGYRGLSTTLSDNEYSKDLSKRACERGCQTSTDGMEVPLCESKEACECVSVCNNHDDEYLQTFVIHVLSMLLDWNLEGGARHVSIPADTYKQPSQSKCRSTPTQHNTTDRSLSTRSRPQTHAVDRTRTCGHELLTKILVANVYRCDFAFLSAHWVRHLSDYISTLLFRTNPNTHITFIGHGGVHVKATVQQVLCGAIERCVVHGGFKPTNDTGEHTQPNTLENLATSIVERLIVRVCENASSQREDKETSEWLDALTRFAVYTLCLKRCHRKDNGDGDEIRSHTPIYQCHSCDILRDVWLKNIKCLSMPPETCAIVSRIVCDAIMYTPGKGTRQYLMFGCGSDFSSRYVHVGGAQIESNVNSQLNAEIGSSRRSEGKCDGKVIGNNVDIGPQVVEIDDSFLPRRGSVERDVQVAGLGGVARIYECGQPNAKYVKVGEVSGTKTDIQLHLNTGVLDTWEWDGLALWEKMISLFTSTEIDKSLVKGVLFNFMERWKFEIDELTSTSTPTPIYHSTDWEGFVNKALRQTHKHTHDYTDKVEGGRNNMDSIIEMSVSEKVKRTFDVFAKYENENHRTLLWGIFVECVVCVASLHPDHSIGTVVLKSMVDHLQIPATLPATTSTPELTPRETRSRASFVVLRELVRYMEHCAKDSTKASKRVDNTIAASLSAEQKSHNVGTYTQVSVCSHSQTTQRHTHTRGRVSTSDESASVNSTNEACTDKNGVFKRLSPLLLLRCLPQDIYMDEVISTSMSQVDRYAEMQKISQSRTHLHTHPDGTTHANTNSLGDYMQDILLTYILDPSEYIETRKVAAEILSRLNTELVVYKCIDLITTLVQSVDQPVYECGEGCLKPPDGIHETHRKRLRREIGANVDVGESSSFETEVDENIYHKDGRFKTSTLNIDDTLSTIENLNTAKLLVYACNMSVFRILRTSTTDPAYMPTVPICTSCSPHLTTSLPVLGKNEQQAQEKLSRKFVAHDSSKNGLALLPRTIANTAMYVFKLDLCETTVSEDLQQHVLDRTSLDVQPLHMQTENVADILRKLRMGMADLVGVSMLAFNQHRSGTPNSTNTDCITNAFSYITHNMRCHDSASTFTVDSLLTWCVSHLERNWESINRCMSVDDREVDYSSNKLQMRAQETNGGKRDCVLGIPNSESAGPAGTPLTTSHGRIGDESVDWLTLSIGCALRMCMDKNLFIARESRYIYFHSVWEVVKPLIRSSALQSSVVCAIARKNESVFIAGSAQKIVDRSVSPTSNVPVDVSSAPIHVNMRIESDIAKPTRTHTAL
eukprot:CFRG5635T1